MQNCTKKLPCRAAPPWLFAVRHKAVPRRSWCATVETPKRSKLYEKSRKKEEALESRTSAESCLNNVLEWTMIQQSCHKQGWRTMDAEALPQNNRTIPSFTLLVSCCFPHHLSVSASSFSTYEERFLSGFPALLKSLFDTLHFFRSPASQQQSTSVVVLLFSLLLFLLRGEILSF